MSGYGVGFQGLELRVKGSGCNAGWLRIKGWLWAVLSGSVPNGQNPEVFQVASFSV